MILPTTNDTSHQVRKKFLRVRHRYTHNEISLLKRDRKKKFLVKRPGGIVKNSHPGGALETKLYFLLA